MKKVTFIAICCLSYISIAGLCNTQEFNQKKVIDRILTYWRLENTSISNDFRSGTMEKWDITSNNRKYKLFAFSANQVFTSKITPIKSKGSWTLSQLAEASETVLYIYELTEKGMVDRAHHQFEKERKDVESLKRKGRTIEAKTKLLNAKKTL